MEYDILIKNGMIMDGMGKPAFRSDIIIQNDRIEDIGLFQETSANTVINAKGLIIAPGFIDVHTHLDFFLHSPRHAEVLESWIRQGVTTIMSGNCGYSPAPINHEKEDYFSDFVFVLPSF